MSDMVNLITSKSTFYWEYVALPALTWQHRYAMAVLLCRSRASQNWKHDGRLFFDLNVLW